MQRVPAGHTWSHDSFDEASLRGLTRLGCCRALSLRSLWRCAPTRSAIGRARSVHGLPGGSLGRASRQHRKLPCECTPWRALLSHNQKLRAIGLSRGRHPVDDVSRIEGSVEEPVLSPGRMEATAGVRVAAHGLLFVSACARALLSHNQRRRARDLCRRHSRGAGSASHVRRSVCPYAPGFSGPASGQALPIPSPRLMLYAACSLPLGREAAGERYCPVRKWRR